RQRPIVESAVAGILGAGGTAHGVVADMTEADGVASIVTETKATFGDADILVVNAPSAPRRSPEHLRGFENCYDDDYLQMFDGFVPSQVRLTRALLPAMKARRWGRLLNIGTIAFKTPHQEDPMPATDVRIAVAPLMR